MSASSTSNLFHSMSGLPSNVVGGLMYADYYSDGKFRLLGVLFKNSSNNFLVITCESVSPRTLPCKILQLKA